MIAERTFDTSIIRRILMDPEMHDRISDDSKADITIDVKSQAWILMKDESVIGVYCLKPLNRYTLEIHAHVLREHRGKSVETGKAALKWIIDNTDYVKVIAEIPVVYPDVIAFTKKFGFVQEGVNRLSVMKHGHLVDQVWLGITREEIIHGLG